MALLDTHIGGQVKQTELRNCAQSCAHWENMVLTYVAVAGMIWERKMHYQKMVLYISLRHTSLQVARKSLGSPQRHL